MFNTYQKLSTLTKALTQNHTLMAGKCRFSPTCSTYAHEALKRHGPIKGSLLAVKRVLKCHPLHPGGYDPVPVNVNQRLRPNT